MSFLNFNKSILFYLFWAEHIKTFVNIWYILGKNWRLNEKMKTSQEE